MWEMVSENVLGKSLSCHSLVSLFFFYCFFLGGHAGSDLWLNPGPPHWEHRALATEPPGKSLVSILSRIVRPLPPPYHLNPESDCTEAWKGAAGYAVRLAAMCGARARRPCYIEPERVVQMPAGQAGGLTSTQQLTAQVTLTLLPLSEKHMAPYKTNTPPAKGFGK